MPSKSDAETLLATILEGIGLPFYAVDKDWRITLYNKAAERHFGQPAETMIGTGLWDHFAEDRSTERGRLLHTAMAERATLKGGILSLTSRPRLLRHVPSRRWARRVRARCDGPAQRGEAA